MGNNSPPIREFSTRKFKYGFSARLFYWEPPPGESKPPPQFLQKTMRGVQNEKTNKNFYYNFTSFHNGVHQPLQLSTRRFN